MANGFWRLWPWKKREQKQLHASQSAKDILGSVCQSATYDDQGTMLHLDLVRLSEEEWGVRRIEKKGEGKEAQYVISKVSIETDFAKAVSFLNNFEQTQQQAGLQEVVGIATQKPHYQSYLKSVGYLLGEKGSLIRLDENGDFFEDVELSQSDFEALDDIRHKADLSDFRFAYAPIPIDLPKHPLFSEALIERAYNQGHNRTMNKLELADLHPDQVDALEEKITNQYKVNDFIERMNASGSELSEIEFYKIVGEKEHATPRIAQACFINLLRLEAFREAFTLANQQEGFYQNPKLNILSCLTYLAHDKKALGYFAVQMPDLQSRVYEYERQGYHHHLMAEVVRRHFERNHLSVGASRATAQAIDNLTSHGLSIHGTIAKDKLPLEMAVDTKDPIIVDAFFRNGAFDVSLLPATFLKKSLLKPIYILMQTKELEEVGAKIVPQISELLTEETTHKKSLIGWDLLGLAKSSKVQAAIIADTAFQTACKKHQINLLDYLIEQDQPALFSKVSSISLFLDHHGAQDRQKFFEKISEAKAFQLYDAFLKDPVLRKETKAYLHQEMSDKRLGDKFVKALPRPLLRTILQDITPAEFDQNFDFGQLKINLLDAATAIPALLPTIIKAHKNWGVSSARNSKNQNLAHLAVLSGDVMSYDFIRDHQMASFHDKDLDGKSAADLLAAGNGFVDLNEYQDGAASIKRSPVKVGMRRRPHVNKC